MGVVTTRAGDGQFTMSVDGGAAFPVRSYILLFALFFCLHAASLFFFVVVCLYSFCCTQRFSKVSGTLSAADGETRVNIEAEVNGHRLTATAAQFKGALHLHLADAALSGRHMHVFDLVQPSVSGDDAAGAASGISAEMPGKIVKFLVDAGAFVNKVRVCSVAAARERPRTDRPLLTTLRAPHLS